MALTVQPVCVVAAFSALGSVVQGQYLTCGFGGECAGFTTSIDNVYNVDTDVAWTRVSRLRLTNYKPLQDNTYLAIYQPPPGENPTPATNMTARLTLPAPSQPASAGLGCLRIRYALENGTMYLADFESGKTKFSVTSNSSQQVNGVSGSLSALESDTQKTMIVVELWPAVEAEFGLDYVRMYRENCTVVSDDDDDDEPFPPPTWPATTAGPATAPPTPAGHLDTTTRRGAAAAAAGSRTALVVCVALFMVNQYK